MIELVGVRKRFGELEALAGLDVSVAPGELVGLLGPNGAGKTTAINVLATLLAPDDGMARVGGVDVTADPDAVRSMIGLTGQFAALDDILTGRENLELFGRLLKLGGSPARRRAAELLERFDLADAADRRVGDYSGGMRRRLDLAVSMLADPAVLFLDEPTTGLDPRSRQALWDVVRDLAARGVTILLTTQYLEEADQLADRIVVIDHGTVIAEGTAAQLKTRVGGAVVEVSIPQEDDRRRARAVVVSLSEDAAGRLTAPAEDPAAVLDVAARLAAAGVVVDDIAIRRPSLDDVFLSLTGHAADVGAADPETPATAVAAGP